MNAFLVISGLFLVAILAFYLWFAGQIGRQDSTGDPVPTHFFVGAP